MKNEIIILKNAFPGIYKFIIFLKLFEHYIIKMFIALYNCIFIFIVFFWY